VKTELKTELETRVKDEVEVRMIRAAIGFYQGTLSDGTRYSVVLKGLTIDHHHMDLELNED